MSAPKQRKGTKSHTMGFPVFALAFAPKKPRLVVGGGGGASKSGVKNSLVRFPFKFVCSEDYSRVKVNPDAHYVFSNE
jgi:hypothetical protein